jgi:alanine-glyoxylate transaminase/serine-glyoxylate transaminase/serine-pyruvate transaminase
MRSKASLKRDYFDLDQMLNANSTGYFPYTPALPLFYGLKEALAVIEEEGLDNIIARHHYLAEGKSCRSKRVGAETLCQRAKMVFGYCYGCNAS